MKEEEARQKAKRRVRELKGFYSHLIMYIIMNFILFMIDYMIGALTWFYWPLMGWGIGLASHGLSVSKFEIPAIKKWEDKKVQELKDEYRE